MTIIKSINVFLDIASSRGCTKVFKLPLYLDAKAHSVILFGRLYSWNLSLSEGLPCLSAMAFHKVPVGFPLGCHKICKRNSECK